MKKWINISIVFVVAIIIFFLGFLRGSKKISAAKFGRYFNLDKAVIDTRIKPPFADAYVFRIGDNIKINGIPTDIYGVQTKNSVNRVINFYLNKWRSKGNEVVSDINKETGYAAFFNKQKKNFRIVNAYKNPENKRTLAFIATSFYNKNQKQREIKDLPTLPGAQSLIHLEYDDYGRKADTIIILSRASVASTIRTFRSQMMSKGWKYKSKFYDFTKNKSNKILLFENEKRECIVHVQKVKYKPQTFVMLTIADKIN